MVFIKQKTADEVRMSDWSSDVCSADLALTRPADTTVEHLWNRKGPDLWYAGDKFNREWLVGWLQNPTTIRPGGVMWFKHAKAGDPHDTIDTAAVEKHPKVDAANAEKLAESLLLLKRTETGRVGKRCVSTGRSRW